MKKTQTQELARLLKKAGVHHSMVSRRPVEIPKKVSVPELSPVALNDLADHCERRGYRFTYNGLQVV